jgi:hypothetical protein
MSGAGSEKRETISPRRRREHRGNQNSTRSIKVSGLEIAVCVNPDSLVIDASRSFSPCSLKIDLGPSKRATGFLELSNASAVNAYS